MLPQKIERPGRQRDYDFLCSLFYLPLCLNPGFSLDCKSGVCFLFNDFVSVSPLVSVDDDDDEYGVPRHDCKRAIREEESPQQTHPQREARTNIENPTGCLMMAVVVLFTWCGSTGNCA